MTQQTQPRARAARDDDKPAEVAKPAIVYLMTDLEQRMILPTLRRFGEQLTQSLADQLAKNLPMGSNVDRDKLVCNSEEIMGRALAFIAQIDPDEFGSRIAGHQLKIQVIPHMMPCPECTAKRIATVRPQDCKACGGQRQIAMVIQPEQRLVSEELIGKPKLALVDPNGRDIR